MDTAFEIILNIEYADIRIKSYSKSIEDLRFNFPQFSKLINELHEKKDITERAKARLFERLKKCFRKY